MTGSTANVPSKETDYLSPPLSNNKHLKHIFIAGQRSVGSSDTIRYDFEANKNLAFNIRLSFIKSSVLQTEHANGFSTFSQIFGKGFVLAFTVYLRFQLLLKLKAQV